MQIARFGDWSGALALMCVLVGVVGSVPSRVTAQCPVTPDARLALAEDTLFGDGQGDGLGSSDCPAPDANGDGEITAADLIYIAQSILPEATPTFTLTPTPATGPAVVTFALAAADGTVIAPIGATAGSDIFQRAAGSGFQIVLEAIPGSAGSEVGKTLFNWNSTDPTDRPDLEIEASRPLGDGDPGVCSAGGIPGFNPPDFSLVQSVANALNDFSCAFDANTNPIRACTVDAFGSPTFISALAHVVQFCLVVNADKAFPLGDTVLTARVRDVSGNLGAPSQIVVRIGNQPVPTATATPTLTPVSSPIPTRSSTAVSTTTPTWTVVSRRTASPTSSRTFLPTTSTATPSTPAQSPTLTRSGSPSTSRTPTPSATAMSTAVASATNTRTVPTASMSPVRTLTAPAGPTGTRTVATPTATSPVSASPTVTRTAVNTSSPVPTGTKTQVFTATPTVRPSATRTSLRSPTPTLTPLPSRSPTTSRTPTLTPTVTLTPTATVTATVTGTPTVTRTPTPTIPPEPVITFFGVTRADDTLVSPIGSAADGTPIYQRGAYNFSLVIEARPGGTLADVGSSTLASSPTTLPDLQVEASNNLGNGSAAVCDDSGSKQGGVPAVVPFDFSPSEAPVINDLSCRFKDGLGAPSGRTTDACTLFYPSGNYHFVDPSSTMQYCGTVTPSLSLPQGDTVIAARVRDSAGNVSAVSMIIVRVP